MIRLSKNLNISYLFGGSRQDVPTTNQQNHEINVPAQLKKLNQYQRTFFYLNPVQHKTFSLYNVFSYLPLSIIHRIARLPINHKTVISSDQIYLPKISPDGIPIYDSITRASTIRMVKSLEAIVIPMAVFLSATPFLMLGAIALNFTVYFKSTFWTLAKNFVIRMQLLPSTQQIAFQKIGLFGVIKTTRVRITDLQYVNSIDNEIFINMSKSLLDKKNIFKVKSTGQLLMFDNNGVWHEKGLFHELVV